MVYRLLSRYFFTLELDQHRLERGFQRHRLVDCGVLLRLLRYPYRPSRMETGNKSSSKTRTMELGKIWPCYQHHLGMLAVHYMGVCFLPHCHPRDSSHYELELRPVGRFHASGPGLVFHQAAQGLYWTESSGWHDEPSLVVFGEVRRSYGIGQSLPTPPFLAHLSLYSFSSLSISLPTL